MRLPILVLLFVVSVSSVLHAQSTNASLSGRVMDPSKAVIAGAAVAAVSVDTHLRHDAITNETGEYYLVNLPPSRYRLEVEMTGLKTLLVSNLTLHFHDSLT